MVGKDYKASMKPLVAEGAIRITLEYGKALNMSTEDERTLRKHLKGQAICPALYWFEDVPEVRRILKVDCPHERLNEDGICRQCGADRRGI